MSAALPTLETPRLLLLPLPRSVMARRLEQDDFRAVLEGPDGPLEVHFPPPWPGAALGLFRVRLGDVPEAGSPWSFTAVRRADGRAVGQLSGKGGPDEGGRLEIGYGFNPEVWTQGLTTEAVIAMTRHFAALPEITEVWAATSVNNPASARVLEKSGFRETGKDDDPRHGPVRLWTYPGDSCYGVAPVPGKAGTALTFPATSAEPLSLSSPELQKS